MLESRHAENNKLSDVGCSGDDEKTEMGKKKGFAKAKQVMFFPFRMAKKQILRPRVKRVSSSISFDKRGFDGTVNHGCGFCLHKFSVSDSKIGSPTDPNHCKFTDEMLRVLIENNDFYSKDSNPHLDV